jgi:hypothetical protein
MGGGNTRRTEMEKSQMTGTEVSCALDEGENQCVMHAQARPLVSPAGVRRQQAAVAY